MPFLRAHHKADLMAELAMDVREHSGFENMALPFCMTIEAEILGSAINFGSLSVEPKIEKEAYSSVSEVPTTKNTEDLLGSGRVDVLLGAITHRIPHLSLCSRDRRNDRPCQRMHVHHRSHYIL